MTVLNVLDFGADPTGTADSTDAINNAILAAWVTDATYLPGGGKVFIPAGSYRTTTGIKLRRGVSLEGVSQKGTRLFTETIGTDILSMFSPEIQESSAMVISSMWLDGGGFGGGGASLIARSGVNADGFVHATLRDVQITRCAGAGVRSRGLVVDFNVERSYIGGNNIGFDHQDGMATTIRYISTQVVFNHTIGGLMKNVPVSEFSGGTIFEKNYGNGLVIRGGNASIVKVDGCYFEDNFGATNLFVEECLSATIRDNYLTYTPNQGPGRSNLFFGVGAKNALVSGNTFNGASAGNPGSLDIGCYPGLPNTIKVDTNHHVGGFTKRGGDIARYY